MRHRSTRTGRRPRSTPLRPTVRVGRRAQASRPWSVHLDGGVAVFTPANLDAMELEEEMSSSDVVLLLGSVPERTSDLVYWLDEARLRYRHGPAFPTLGSLIAHLVEAAPRVDALLRHAHLDGQTSADVRAAIDPGH